VEIRRQSEASLDAVEESGLRWQHERIAQIWDEVFNEKHVMKIFRVGLNSLALVMADLAGIAGGAVLAFRLTGLANQVMVQVPMAAVLSVGFFCVWRLSLRALRFRRLQLAGLNELGMCWVSSFLCAPLVFIPVHYFTQGYVTGVSNLLALALYQLPVNLLTLFGPTILKELNRGEKA